MMYIKCRICFKRCFWISIKALKQIVRKNLKRAFFPFNSIKTFHAEEYKMSVFTSITQHKEIMLHQGILVRFSLTIRLWQPACDLCRSVKTFIQRLVQLSVKMYLMFSE